MKTGGLSMSRKKECLLCRPLIMLPVWAGMKPMLVELSVCKQRIRGEVLRLMLREQNQLFICPIRIYAPYQHWKIGRLEAFVEGAKTKQEAARYWLKMLSRLDLASFEAILSRIPDTEITDPAREFSCKMLELNSKRLLDVNF